MILFLRGTSATFVMSSKWLHKHDQRVCVCVSVRSESAVTSTLLMFAQVCMACNTCAA